MDYDKALEKAKKYGQEHIFQFWEELSDDEKKNLLDEVNTIDFDELKELYKLSKKEVDDLEYDKAKPPISKDKESIYLFEKEIIKIGEDAIRDGKVACLLLAGGQASRLGFDGPKGCFELSPIKKKTLFQILAEKIKATQNKYNTKLYWYIMTSKYNDQVTKYFFKKNKFFGLDEDKIVFFQQEMISAIDFNGKLFLKSKSEIFQNPNGTGGVYSALGKSGILDQMKKDNIEYFSFINVDNPIVEIFDPAFIGETIRSNSEFGIKCVKKVNPEERVGLVGVIDGKTYILEYFKLPQELNDKENEDDSLYLNASNLNILTIKKSFVDKVLKEGLLPYSVAKKKIPHINDYKEIIKPTENNGFKFEKFVFDVIPLAKNPFVIMTKREDEFAPVKNAEGNDSPMTSRLLMNRKAKKWMSKAGIDKEFIDQLDFVEVSPLFALTESDFVKKVKDNIEFYENEMIDVESFYFD